MMSIALGDNNTGWCVDTQGQVWFCTNVTREHPFGQGMWYQVSKNSQFNFIFFFFLILISCDYFSNLVIWNWTHHCRLYAIFPFIFLGLALDQKPVSVKICIYNVCVCICEYFTCIYIYNLLIFIYIYIYVYIYISGNLKGS